MGKPLIILAILMFVPACGPGAAEEDDVPRTLEYEDSRVRLYRAGRRVDAIYEYEREDGLERTCGYLTDRAYDDLESTLAALDPGVDYGEHPADCSPGDALVHVDGLEHSPFECGVGCCHSGLFWAPIVYFMILTNLDGTIPGIGIPNVEPEPYVAIEPDQPCPD